MTDKHSETAARTSKTVTKEDIDYALTLMGCWARDPAPHGPAGACQRAERVIRHLMQQVETKPARDAEHCDFPDCEQHNTLVVERLRALLAERMNVWCDNPLPGRAYPEYACGKCWTCRVRKTLAGVPPLEQDALTPSQLGQAIADTCELVPLPHPPGCECRLCLPVKASAPPMAMLPNVHHPGQGCSCRECLRRWPDKASAPHDKDCTCGLCVHAHNI